MAATGALPATPWAGGVDRGPGAALTWRPLRPRPGYIATPAACAPVDAGAPAFNDLLWRPVVVLSAPLLCPQSVRCWILLFLLCAALAVPKTPVDTARQYSYLLAFPAALPLLLGIRYRFQCQAHVLLHLLDALHRYLCALACRVRGAGRPLHHSADAWALAVALLGS